MKKILVVCQYYYPERIGLTDICEELVKRNYDITVLTGLPNYPEGRVPKEYKFFRKRKEIINGVKIRRCFEIGRRKGKIWLALNYISFLVSSSLKVLFLGKKYDKVFCYQHSPVTMGIPAVMYKKMYKRELILYCFDLWPESLKTYNINENSIIFKIIKKVSKYVYKNCDKIIISSRPFEEYFIDVHNIPKDKITYIPQHSIDYGVSDENKNNSKTHFLFSGNIGKMQNIEIVIEAVNILKNKDNIIVDIVGYGSNYDDLVNLTQKLNLADVIRFHGRKEKEEMRKLYNRADVMLLTLKGGSFVSKTLPLKVQSYMSTGKPIIAAIEGAAVDIINEAKCGLCVKPDDIVGLSNLMNEYKNNKKKYIEMGKNGRKYFDKTFLFKNNIAKLIKNVEN